MGASQSSGNDSTNPNTEVPHGKARTCYYELLGVDVAASDDQIKKAYRKKALELHPDRNYGSVEAATKQFADVQSAYEILSDPQERAWYDSHRDNICRVGGDNGEHYEHNIRVTTAEEVLQMFSRFNRRVDFSDSSMGFYGALREFFDRLAKEEEAACAWSGLDLAKYPSFGYKDDDYEDGVRAFYSIWNSFATKKGFSWKDVYNYSEAPDRHIRRLMEKENKRLREEGTREFNDAVRSLVAFVRKRDPRFISTKQTEEERQKVLKDAAVAQAGRSRAANQAKLDAEAVPTWMTSVSDANEVADNEWAEASPVKVDIDCVVCNKTFKSEKQYEAHEKSKKHIKAVEQMQRQMRREDLDISQTSQDKAHDSMRTPGTVAESPNGWHKAGAPKQPEAERIPSSPKKCQADSVDTDKDLEKSQDDPHLTPNGSDLESVSDEDYASRQEVEQRLSRKVEVNIELSSSMQQFKADYADEATLGNGEATELPKLGKAKEKRAKKAAQKSTMNAQVGNEPSSCAVCLESFPSRTQLFRHLSESAHGRPMAKATKAGKGKQ